MWSFLIKAPKPSGFTAILFTAIVFLPLSGCNRHLEILKDAPEPENLPPTDPEKMSFFYQINQDQAHSLLKNNREVLVFDFRPQADYAAAHLPRANHLDWPNEHLAEILEPFDRKTPVLAYGNMNPELFNGVIGIRDLGFLNVHWIQLGFSSWVDGGYPVYDAENKEVPKEKAKAMSDAEKEATF